MVLLHRVRVVCGDGGLMISSQMLEMALFKLHLVVVILEDSACGMIRWKHVADQFADLRLTFRKPDFIKYADAYGAKGWRVTATEDPTRNGGRHRRRRRLPRLGADRLWRVHAFCLRNSGHYRPIEVQSLE
ncbi:hypothetical protein AA309_03410 [Microvirga vignae]|uniref:Thiamine pyrophosphate enzyme TPP-binding domain-containing protein n=2 Tax=Microvirga vignae TaxID=1225564 RepID=A0A0H1RGU8_9HYPH|nr:hypothetical protein AA309_03410 [Microvirga vignae]